MCERGIVCVREKDSVCEREDSVCERKNSVCEREDSVCERKDSVCEREIVCVGERFFLSVCLSVYLFLRHTIEEH